MDTPIPYFSIVIPTYNRGDKLIATIAGVLKQEFLNFELVIVDDGSLDNTEKLISNLANEKIKYFKTENRERSHARNFGLKHAAGIYINYFDSDDLMYPDRLQKVFDWIQRNNDPAVLFTHYDFVNDQGKVVGQTERFYKSFTKDLLFNNFLATGAVFLRRSVAVQYLFHEDRRIITAEDWELWLRVHAQYEFQECLFKTFAILQHTGRSLNSISAERIKVRDLYFIQLVKNNPALKTKYGKALDLFIADRYTFIALTAAINKHRSESLEFLVKSFASSIKVIARRRFWGTIKTLLWPLRKRS